MTQQNFIQYMQLVEEHVTLEQQNKFFQDLLQQNRVERPENPGVTLADFQNTKPISFAYTPEPMDAEDWLMDTERKLNTVGCNDQEKVRYATHLLCGPAASWWDNIVAVYPAGKVFTWEEFARKFRESNVPESIVELKRREFESLEQKNKAEHAEHLRKCLKTPDEPISHDELELQPDLTYIEKPAKILEESWKQLRNKAIKYCKIQWKHHPEREATWEKEEDEENIPRAVRVLQPQLRDEVFFKGERL
ncbi:hypothetical protein QYE76_005942 [Lolium multiflorum]|uniref:Retrotransposon gag domain-containing protein n=1 Tax=Lolium multiflorum TaxID=4521 RepID=A0AAD8RVI7_LOLMU|nr:hypothetical protein QYE76_005942 [Lolium multiflorum]